MLRFWGKGGPVGEVVGLTKEELNHAKVRRVREGEVVGLLDGEGGTWLGVFSDGQIKITEAKLTPKPLPQVTLFMALTASSTFETILEESTQLGVEQIIPLDCQNAFYKSADLPKIAAKRERWEKIIHESCKQSSNAWLPKLGEITPWARALAGAKGTPTLVAAMEGEITPWRDLKLAGAQKLNVWVGPEGDFSPDEYRQLREAGAVGVGLGATVLKSETAAVAMLAMLKAIL